MAGMICRALVVAGLIALVETANGIVRLRVLYGLMKVRTAKIASLGAGCALILLLAWILVPWVGPQRVGEAVVIGLVWVAVLVGYDVLVGRLVAGASWRRIVGEFNLRQGNYLSLGMIFLFLSPLIVMSLRQVR